MADNGTEDAAAGGVSEGCSTVQYTGHFFSASAPLAPGAVVSARTVILPRVPLRIFQYSSSLKVICRGKPARISLVLSIVTGFS